MSLFKTARYFKAKLAQVISAELADGLQKAMGLASVLVKSMEIYDAGYEEVYSVASKLHELYKLSTKAEDQEWLVARGEALLPAIKGLLSAAMGKVDFPAGKSKLNEIARVVNGLKFSISAPEEFGPPAAKEELDPALTSVVDDLSRRSRPTVEETDGFFPG